MARYTRGYRAHRSPRRGSLALKIILAALAVLLVVGIALMAVLDVEYTDDGVRVRLPWAQEEPDPQGEISDPVVVVTQ